MKEALDLTLAADVSGTADLTLRLPRRKLLAAVSRGDALHRRRRIARQCPDRRLAASAGGTGESDIRRADGRSLRRGTLIAKGVSAGIRAGSGGREGPVERVFGHPARSRPRPRLTPTAVRTCSPLHPQGIDRAYQELIAGGKHQPPHRPVRLFARLQECYRPQSPVQGVLRR